MSTTKNQNYNREVPSELIFVANESDGTPILCRVWTPPRPRGAVVFLHGGMFSQGNLNSHPQVSRALAVELNLAVLTASFRDGSRTTYSTGETMTDLQSIARYFRSEDGLPWPWRMRWNEPKSIL
jgi:acetyl esterase/lipase